MEIQEYQAWRYLGLVEMVLLNLLQISHFQFLNFLDIVQLSMGYSLIHFPQSHSIFSYLHPLQFFEPLRYHRYRLLFHHVLKFNGACQQSTLRICYLKLPLQFNTGDVKCPFLRKRQQSHGLRDESSEFNTHLNGSSGSLPHRRWR